LIEIKVLDKGFVRLIDYMGDDKSAVDAARVSYYNHENSENRKMDEKDIKLSLFLMKEGHLSPFEHLVMKFHVKAPIFVARQWFRHRIGVSYNEVSRRYTTKNSDEFYIPDHIRIQDTKNKQGSVKIDNLSLEQECIDKIKDAYENAYKIYEELLEKGVAKEMARIVLPVGQYTEFYFTVNVRALMHFLDLRADSHAQWEIQEYAKAMSKIFEKVFPITYKHYVENLYQGDILK